MPRRPIMVRVFLSSLSLLSDDLPLYDAKLIHIGAYVS